ncbi:MAG: Asp23/Gls24 family envelope stress response protein [Anaerolineales bacterium]|jgi:uncharacterized alkaline shock family protein YloU
MSEYHSLGKTTLTPEVLLTIARMSAMEVEGVNRMAPVRGGVNSLFGRGNAGVRIVIEDSDVFVDLYLVLDKDVNIREVSRNVQHQVARAIAEMTGLKVGHVNIHIEDIDYHTEA